MSHREIEAKLKNLPVLGDDTARLEGERRAREAGIDPHLNPADCSEEQIDKVFDYLRKNDMPYCTWLPIDTVDPLELLKQFQCNRCGRCCLEIGNIPLMEDEPKRIARYLGVSGRSIKKLTTLNSYGRVFKTPCPFYEDGCSIYSVRPLACVAFPLVDPVIFKGRRIIQLSTFCNASIDLCKRILLECIREGVYKRKLVSPVSQVSRVRERQQMCSGLFEN